VSDTIWKFTLRPWSAFLDMPRAAQLLSAGAQGDDVVVWAAVDPNAERVQRVVTAVPTGHRLPPIVTGGGFVGTVQMDDGLVFHVFDGGERS
jgi:hypothetical protein